MSDGTVLLADLTRLPGASDAPLLLIRSPYGRRTLMLRTYAKTLARYGFQVLVQSCRGTDGCGGSFDRPFAVEVADGRDTVAWLREQSFYPGRFATFGPSYLGYTQLALPPEAKSELFAAVIQIAPNSVEDFIWPDGAFALESGLAWAAMARRGPHRTLANLLNRRRTSWAIVRAGRHGPLIETYVEATGGRMPFVEDWLNHPPGDPWWGGQDRSDGLDSFECPVLVQTGWFDLYLETGIEQFRRVSKRRDDARLTIGPWTHQGLVVKGAQEILKEAAAFLHVSAAGRSHRALPVRVMDARTGMERQIDSWPPPSIERVLYLHPRKLGARPPSVGSDATGFTYEPDSPTPAVGGSRLSRDAGPQDNGRLEARDDVITFDMDAVTDELHLAGNPSVSLWVKSDVPAPQLLIRLNIVDNEGRSTNLVDRMTTVAIPADSAKPVLASVELPPVWVELRPGERLRLLIAGGAFPQYARSPGTGESPALATIFREARIAIYHDHDHPSTLTVRIGDAS